MLVRVSSTGVHPCKQPGVCALWSVAYKTKASTACLGFLGGWGVRNPIPYDRETAGLRCFSKQGERKDGEIYI